MERIPFAQFVANEMAEGKFFLYWGWESWSYARSTLEKPDREFASEMYEPKERDDWKLSFRSSWFGMVHHARIIRGPDRYVIIAKGKEWKALRDAARVINRRKNAEQAVKDAERAKKELDAAWWP